MASIRLRRCVAASSANGNPGQNLPATPASAPHQAVVPSVRAPLAEARSCPCRYPSRQLGSARNTKSAAGRAAAKVAAAPRASVLHDLSQMARAAAIEARGRSPKGPLISAARAAIAPAAAQRGREPWTNRKESVVKKTSGGSRRERPPEGNNASGWAPARHAPPPE